MNDVIGFHVLLFNPLHQKDTHVKLTGNVFIVIDPVQHS